MSCIRMVRSHFAIIALATHDVLGVVSTPLYDQKLWKFAGMLTMLDIIHLIQFYWKKQAATFESAAADVETFRIETLRGTFFRIYAT